MLQSRVSKCFGVIFAFLKIFQGFRSKIWILPLKCLLCFVFIDKNFFYPPFSRFPFLKKKTGLSSGHAVRYEFKSACFWTAKRFLSTSWVTILGSRCFCGQYFFKKKNVWTSSLNWAYGIFVLKGGVMTTCFRYDGSKFFDAT